MGSTIWPSILQTIFIGMVKATPVVDKVFKQDTQSEKEKFWVGTASPLINFHNNGIIKIWADFRKISIMCHLR